MVELNKKIYVEDICRKELNWTKQSESNLKYTKWKFKFRIYNILWDKFLNKNTPQIMDSIGLHAFINSKISMKLF